MISTLRQRDFALLWSGGLVSLTGDWLLIVAVPFYVYTRTGSALATSAAFAVAGVPWLLFGSVAGVFVDRWDRRRTMIACDLIRTVLLLGLLAVPVTGMLWPIYVVTFVETSIGTFFVPARNALIPVIVPEQRLTAANSLSAASNNLARLSGPSVGGVLLVAIGFSGVVLADSISYLGSALAIALMNVPRRPGRGPEANAGSAVAGVWRDWREGLRMIVGDRFLAVLFVAVGVAILGDSLLSGVLVPFIKNVVHTDARGFGWLMTARGAGGLAGSFIIGVLAVLRPPRLLASSLVALGVIVVVMTLFRSLPAEMGLIALAGIPAIGWTVAEQTILQTRVPDALRGRVFATYMTAAAVLGTLGLLIAGALVGEVGAVAVLCITGGLYAAGGVLCLLLLPSASAQADDSQRDEPRAVDARTA